MHAALKAPFHYPLPLKARPFQVLQVVPCVAHLKMVLQTANKTRHADELQICKKLIRLINQHYFERGIRFEGMLALTPPFIALSTSLELNDNATYGSIAGVATPGSLPPFHSILFRPTASLHTHTQGRARALVFSGDARKCLRTRCALVCS